MGITMAMTLLPEEFPYHRAWKVSSTHPAYWQLYPTVDHVVPLARGDVSIDRDAVLITPDLSDEAVRRYRWDPARRSYVFVRGDSDTEEPPPVSRT